MGCESARIIQLPKIADPRGNLSDVVIAPPSPKAPKFFPG
jgi:hypothetical protein